eukprot:CAMPEP_0201484040 /NCGR_PEP_ID=MMETSP0151_2-20130828/8233_1 /ASSEMBLY_ACC=CAM_ASM_000257 /TAXON_ID=200890 /ORGANISM="Paramoeba atlantica, Strain 621/1 / CCAP 1560/9" /LENGTH=377 /DNA_ID=CAMNT_0047867489 /DNA_START=74 /DNA_END=1207 /DNA_ORIENTATION=+
MELHGSATSEEMARETQRLLTIFGMTKHLFSPDSKLPSLKRIKKGLRILALDGGGIRALVTLRLLQAIEDHCRVPVSHLFDLVGCTSTGAILASLVFIKKLPLNKCAQKYKEFGRKVFASKTGDKDVMRSDSNWTKFMNYVNWMSTGGLYAPEEFVEALREACGGERMIDYSRDPSVPLMFFVASSVNVNPPQPFLYRNYNLPPETPSRYRGVCYMNLEYALRSTTAAPGYFDEFTSEIVPDERQCDGGLLHNNPSGVALHESLKLFGSETPISVILNVGTGRFPVGTTDNTGLKCILNALVRSASSSEKIAHVLEDSLALAGIPFFCLNPVDPVFDCGILELREEVLNGMEAYVEEFVKQNKEKIAEICKRLLDDE